MMRSLKEILCGWASLVQMNVPDTRVNVLLESERQQMARDKTYLSKQVCEQRALRFMTEERSLLEKKTMKEMHNLTGLFCLFKVI